MGTPEFAVEPLRRLVDGGYNVVAVVAMPDKPSGRGLKLKGSAVKEYAVSVGLPVLQPEKLSNTEFLDELRALNLDLGIVVAFKMLPTAVWSMPKFGTFNLHTSLLPDYRGAAPINWAIINGDKVSGITTFMLDRDIDTGDILMRESLPIGDDESAGSLHDRMMLMGGDLVLKSVDLIANGDVKTLPQSSIDTNVQRPAPKIFKEDCKLNWEDNISDIYNKVRGLTPYPAAWCEIGDDTFKIFESHIELFSSEMIGEAKQAEEVKEIEQIERIEQAEETEQTEQIREIGQIVTDNKKFLKVVCAGGYLVIDELQMAGKKRMKTEDFLRGHKGF